MKIEIVKQRRKTISLKIVDKENAVLKVPQNLSESKIKEFLDGKSDWIAKTVAKLNQNDDFSKTFDLEHFIYLNGQKVVATKDISLGFENLSKLAKSKIIQNYYLSMFKKLSDRANELSQQTGLGFKDIKPVSSVRVWGSYNSKRLMKLNYKLLILPNYLVDYVIYHELCHSIHMNHKPQFWRDLEKLCPDHKKLKKELTKYSFVLKTNF